MQETKTDSLDEIDIPGYKVHLKHRKTISKVKSGGIGLIYKDKYDQFINLIDSDSKLVQWFSISKRLTRENDILCGIVYIPPENSTFSHNEPYFEILEELRCYENKYSKILLFGDFNSRTKSVKDYIDIDQSVFHENDLDIVFEELREERKDFDTESCSVTLNRNNCDTVINNYGYKLIDFCKSSSLYILNGRTEGDLPRGKCTCKNVSCVDYFICSSNMLCSVLCLDVLDYCSMLSDAHNAVRLELNFKGISEGRGVESEMGQTTRVKLWDPDKSDTFASNLNHQNILNTMKMLTGLEEQEKIAQNDLDIAVKSIDDIFIASAECSFGYIDNRIKSAPSSKKLSWYGPQCKLMRRKWHNAKYLYKFNKSDNNKMILKQASKIYKKTMRKNYVKFKKYQVRKLKELKYKNPKTYWKILNGNKQEAIKCSTEHLFDFFKTVNSGDYDGENGNVDLSNIDAQNIDNDEINGRITLNEILENVKKLKTNKSCGIDSVLNEHIKSTIHIMGPLYERLFNLILDCGVIPEVWTIGLIKPIYKQKGDASKPENYRPITLLSCLGKLFTGIISNRLYTYAEKYDLITSSQAGFRKKHSTIDHIFVMHCLTEILNLKRKHLYCAFIDLKQAFDTVWRDGMWHKLINCNITGKCYRLIQNMYRDIKSCIMVNGKQTDFFSCNIGLRQGENLSPFLFTVYLNDLEAFFFKNYPDGGIECFSSEFDDTLYIYLKLFILLYADDTAILSDSAQGLQSALNLYNNYCIRWKLKINISKSKVMVFSKGRSGNYNFTLNNDIIEVVNVYKYLGILFSKSGNVFAAKKAFGKSSRKGNVLFN